MPAAVRAANTQSTRATRHRGKVSSEAILSWSAASHLPSARIETPLTAPGVFTGPYETLPWLTRARGQLQSLRRAATLPYEMERRQLGPQMDLFFPRGEEDAADLIEQAVVRSLAVISEKWGLPRRRCRVYVATAWLPVVLHSTPRYLLPVGLLALPFWGPRIRRFWPAAAGWTQRFTRRPAVCIKPPWLLEKADRTVGEMLYVREQDPRKKVEHVTCHELTHALTAHLRLPAWLNEGVAMLAVDAYLGQPTVRPDSLYLLPSGGRQGAPEEYRKLLGMKLKGVAGLYARAYWTTRFLEEKHSALLRRLMTKRVSRHSIEKQVAAALGLRRRDLWKAIDRVVVDHFADLLADDDRGM